STGQISENVRLVKAVKIDNQVESPAADLLYEPENIGHRSNHIPVPQRNAVDCDLLVGDIRESYDAVGRAARNYGQLGLRIVHADSPQRGDRKNDVPQLAKMDYENVLRIALCQAASLQHA